MATDENIPLYAESKLTRKQAINEIANVILRSNMKPQIVKDALDLLQKLLPNDNTLPNDIDEFFSAMMSSENDWRLAQYLIRHKQCPLLLSSNESSSNSDDENELTHYDRLQQCLRPITDLSRGFDLNYATTMTLDQRSQSESDSANPLNFIESLRQLINETSSMISTDESSLPDTTRVLTNLANNTENEFNLSAARRMCEQFKDDSDDETSDNHNNNKLCCFEMNGYDLLNGGSKRRRYY